MHSRSVPYAFALGLAVGSAALMTAFGARADTCAQVEVHNVHPDQGMLMVAAFADAATFNKVPAAAQQIRPSAATMTISLCGLSGPNVALMLYQDINGNGKLDRNVVGIPSEPWGASGKPAAMTAPVWETTSVPLDGSTIIVNLSK